MKITDNFLDKSEFDSNLKHCAVDHTDAKYRIAINFNYL